jgi:hypothetical protein
VRRVLRAALTMALLLGSAAAAPVASAAEPTFGQPTSSAVLGQPLTVSSTISGDDVAAVDVLLRLDGYETTVVVEAEPAEPAGTWQIQQELDIASSALCACIVEAPGSPNTVFSYQFRVTGADGRSWLGPEGRDVVEDDRFEWRTIEQDLVRVHWYAGDEPFALSAAQTANEAIDRAAELLGTTLPEPVDLFVYDTQQALVEAVSPNRENIAGQANPAIDTMFVHVPSDQSAGAFAGEVIRHELTHLVFDEATENQYHAPPRWLDEGVAVYLSVGYTSYYRAPVDSAVADRTLIPLQGLRGLFPATQDGFFLAYGESVAAVDFFVRTHGEERLWELVRSYADGLSDDEAFTRATGGDVEVFNAAWFESLNVDPIEPLGPQPAQPGREPDEWGSEPPAPSTPGPSQTSGQPAPAATPTAAPVVGPNPGRPAADLTSVAVILGLIVLVLVGAVVIAIVARQYRAQQPPRPPRS